MRYYSLLFFFFLCSFLQAQISGRVFIDANNNGLYDLSEKGVANVCISDGFTVVQTNVDGLFTLSPQADSRFLFMTTPFGYFAANGHYLKLQDSTLSTLDFPLQHDPHQQKDFLDFIQITDTETSIYGTWIDNVRNFSRANKSSFIMHTGDICYEDGMRFHAQQVNSKLMGRPVYYTVGNHDLVKGAYGEQMFESLFGPSYYSFEAGPAHFVVTPMWNGDYKPSYTKDQVIAWLKQDLLLKGKDKPLIFINHDFDIGSDYVLRGERDSIDLKHFNLKAWLFGHWHDNFVWNDIENDVKIVSSNAPNKGGIDHAVEQFLHIKLTGAGIASITPRYTNLRSHVKIAKPVLTENKLKLHAIAYDSDRPIKNVSASILDAERNLLSTFDLSAVSDWAWEGHTREDINRDRYVELQVNYVNGEYDIRREYFGENKKMPSMDLIWTSNLESNIWKAGPLLHGGKVYAATIDDAGNGKAAIIALNAATGKQIWRFNTKNSVKQKMRIAAGILVTTDVEGNVYALDAETGALIWQKELHLGRTLPNYMSAGALQDNVYYTGFGSYLSALDLQTGQLLWKNRDWNGGQAMPGELYATATSLITGANWNSLFLHDRRTGKLLWSKKDEGIRFRSSGIAMDGQHLFVAGLNTLFVLDEPSGKEIRKHTFSEDFKSMGSPLVHDDLLVVPTGNCGIMAVDKQSLEKRWHFTTRESLIYTSSYTSPERHELVATVESAVVPFKDYFVFGGSDGFLYMVDRRGKLIAELEIGAPILGDPFIADDEIFITDFAGNVHRIHFKS
ncbi:PQQ-binding-like beta-propeller repeat protein [Sphingobacterium deserti]|uniref:Metallophosphoesterase n=1 Tax=Sphingobacterium deserti TaxID=1229276 RepID=A0A0B8T1V7_9SPHI|nr:PQQ-binding-like beta-propeller repeat protein [Sphingobacterium deserti]KGE12693.1 hypothetical protein DI53_3432 [Sphingobacterium deserti]